MNTQFENRYFSTDKMLCEYVHKVICRKLKLTGGILCVVCFVMLLVGLYYNAHIQSAVLGVCLFLSLSVVLLTPVLTVRQYKESSKRIHNGKSFETVVSFGDNISISEGSFSLTVEYSQILKVYSLRHSYVLMFGKNNGIILSPDHFTAGTFEDFKEFIKTKISNA